MDAGNGVYSAGCGNVFWGNLSTALPKTLLVLRHTEQTGFFRELSGFEGICGQIYGKTMGRGAGTDPFCQGAGSGDPDEPVERGRLAANLRNMGRKGGKWGVLMPKRDKKHRFHPGKVPGGSGVLAVFLDANGGK